VIHDTVTRAVIEDIRAMMTLYGVAVIDVSEPRWEGAKASVTVTLRIPSSISFVLGPEVTAEIEGRLNDATG